MNLKLSFLSKSLLELYVHVKRGDNSSLHLSYFFVIQVCQSGMCDGGQCVECENDGHCPAGQWCKNKDLPLILNDCVNKLSTGSWCVRNAQCTSGKSNTATAAP